jgi:hypothetical protein
MLLKVVIVLALAIPLSIIVLGTAVGVLGMMFALAILALKLAFFGLVGWGLFRLISRVLRGPSTGKRIDTLAELPPVDPHYQAAMRELDRELGDATP